MSLYTPTKHMRYYDKTNIVTWNKIIQYICLSTKRGAKNQNTNSKLYNHSIPLQS